MERKMEDVSPQEDSCSQEEIELKMSVTIRRDAFKIFDSVDWGEEILRKIVSQATDWQKGHTVNIIRLEGTWRLEGCFGCIKKIRTALQAEIRKKLSPEEGRKLSSVDLANDRQSYQENDKMQRTVAPEDNSIPRGVEREQSGSGRGSDDHHINDKFQQRAEDGEYSNSGNLKNAERKANTLKTNNDKIPEVKPSEKESTNSDNSVGRDDLETEGSSKDVKSSGMLTQPAIYPDSFPLKTDVHSPKRERKLVVKSQEEKLIKYENNGVANSHSSEGRDDLKKDGVDPPKDFKYLEKAKEQERYKESSASKYNDNTENTRHAAKDRESTHNSPGLQENQINYQERDRICALTILPSIDIDEDIFYYLVRCRNQELSRVSDKCNLFESYKVEQGHKLAVDVKPQYRLESVTAEFGELYRQATTDHVQIPEGVDLESLKSLVEAMPELKDVELRFMNKERVCKIAGCYRDTSRAKDHLLYVIKSNLPTSHKYDTSQNKTARLTIQITNTSMHNEPTRTVQWSPAAAAISQARMSVYTVLNQSHDSLLLSVSNSLTVEVKYGDLTNTINADVVVSCINKQLDWDGPLSYQIMRAAGPGAQTELLSHKHRLSSLPVGCLVHTSAGNLKGVKATIHVVRPQADEFLLNDQKLMIALRTVFANCLSYTNDVLKLTSICVPPVGFGFFGAQMVVDSFLDAVETFASAVNHDNPSAAAPRRPHHLNYIQLVSNEYDCINKLIPHIKYRMGAH